MPSVVGKTSTVRPPLGLTHHSSLYPHLPLAVFNMPIMLVVTGPLHILLSGMFFTRKASLASALCAVLPFWERSLLAPPRSHSQLSLSSWMLSRSDLCAPKSAPRDTEAAQFWGLWQRPGLPSLAWIHTVVQGASPRLLTSPNTLAIPPHTHLPSPTLFHRLDTPVGSQCLLLVPWFLPHSLKTYW